VAEPVPDAAGLPDVPVPLAARSSLAFDFIFRPLAAKNFP
jgi:hypothetical protein